MRRESLICLALLVIILIGFWPAGRLGFIRYDDYGSEGYIVDNTNIQTGITFESVRWTFTTTHASNWHPVTWLSHMLDCQLFGLKASGHHWMNLGFHIANTLLLFLVLRQMTQAVWRSALVAALFGLHPLHVQSVAWVSERKDLLSGFFAMLTLLFYTRFAQAASSRTGTLDAKSGDKGSGVWRPGSGDYWLALVFFALGLMSKPMLVTLPVILLLLDFWPLKRISDLKSAPQPRKGAWPRGAALRGFLRGFTHSTLNHLLLEKAPFLALSLASGIVTVWAQSISVVPMNYVPWDWRIENSLTSYTAYLGKTFWPENLAIFYPYTRIQPWEFFSSGLLLICLSVFCIRRMRRQPWLLVGWFWFLVMLLPVIGLVQVSIQSMADRYTYLPSIGLFIIVAWGMAGIASISNLWRSVVTVGAALLLPACLLVTRHQLSYWQDSVTLFSRALEVTGENPMGHFFLGNAYQESGNLDEAARNYRSVLRSAPNSEDVHYRLGYILLLQKRWPEAGVQFDEVLRLNPNNAFVHKFLGDALAAQKNFAGAEAEYSTALQLRPRDAVISEALALLAKKVEIQKVLASLHEALKTQPTPEAHAQIAAIRTMQGEFQDAIMHYTEALRLRPDSPDGLNNLAWLLATCPDARIRDGAQAVQHAERACELTHYVVTPIVGTLAAAYAEAGRFDDAIAMAQKACALASESGEQDLLKRNQELLALYLKHQPYHEVANLNQAEPSAVNHSPGSAEKLVPGAR